MVGLCASSRSVPMKVPWAETISRVKRIFSNHNSEDKLEITTSFLNHSIQSDLFSTIFNQSLFIIIIQNYFDTIHISIANGNQSAQTDSKTYCSPSRPGMRYSDACDRLMRHARVSTIHGQCRNRSTVYSVQISSTSFRRSSVFVSACRLW